MAAGAAGEFAAPTGRNAAPRRLLQSGAYESGAYDSYGRDTQADNDAFPEPDGDDAPHEPYDDDAPREPYGAGVPFHEAYADVPRGPYAYNAYGDQLQGFYGERAGRRARTRSAPGPRAAPGRGPTVAT